MNLNDIFAVFVDIGPATLAVAACAVFLSAVLRGFTGFGFALAAVPLLGLLFAPVLAVTTVILLQVLVGALDVRAGRQDCDWGSVKWLAAGAILGSPIGVLLLGYASPAVARVAIGSISLVAALSLGRGAAAAIFPVRPVGLAAGFLAGLFNGIAAMPGPPVVAFYLALGVKRNVMRASLLIFFMSTSLAALLMALAVDMIDQPALVLALASLPVMVGGSALGGRLSRYGSDRLHKTVSIVMLIAIAAASILRGLHDLRVF